MLPDALSPRLRNPAVAHRRRRGCGHRAGAYVTDDVEGLFDGVVHAQHLVSALGLVCRLLHQAVLIS